METKNFFGEGEVNNDNSGPHSLGTLIEWKLSKSVGLANSSGCPPCPHSLGTLIEWKPTALEDAAEVLEGPHSLGTLIEWKQEETSFLGSFLPAGPHSLGTLIEWKLSFVPFSITSDCVPTRWGH